MDTSNKFPTTLTEAVTMYSDERFAIATMAGMRWPNGVTCPHCGFQEVHHLEKYNRWECKNKHAKRQFTVKVGTVFEDSPIAVGKWLMAIWMLTADKNGISSYEIHRAIGVTQKSAWFMMHRIRLALKQGSIEKMSGTVEADESFIGGKARNMHAHKRAERFKGKGRGAATKAIVAGLLERNEECSQVRVKMVRNTRINQVQKFVRSNVKTGSSVMTDALRSYRGLGDKFIHESIDHAIAYVRGQCHTNGLENFWSLMKRTLRGTYVACEPFHLPAYLDEQVFRFNNRKMTDGDRFLKALGGVSGKRVTYAELIGKIGTPPAIATDATKMGTWQA